jgi:citrate synthase
VKPETLYAYVSRGMLTRHPAPDGRRSLFDRAEVERLAARSRRGGRAGALELVVDTQLTLIDPDGALYYRGRDATELARTATYESVAELLWGGEAAAGGEAARGGEAAGGGEPWRVSGGAGMVSVETVLPGSVRPVDRIRAFVALAAAADPLRHDLRPPAVRHTARALIAGMVGGLPRLSEPADESIAARLWSRLSPAPPSPTQQRALNAALVLLADHELALSAFAARIAASGWSDPYLVVLAGLSALGGPLHGGAPGAVERLLAGIGDPADVPAALGERLAANEPLPGFGHAVYRGRDPRADTLLDLLRDAAPPRLAVVEELLRVVTRHDGPAPNVDLAVGALSNAFGLIPGAGEAIFAVARSAGLIAHALEEYPHRLRFRARAAYVGPPA